MIALTSNTKPGERHAEIRAIEEARTRQADLSKCILYTNLEPCCNYGNVESCVAIIIAAKIPEVHVAMEDPYILVRGKGIAALREAGVKVVYGEHEKEAMWQNKRYIGRLCPHCGWVLEG